MIKLHVVKEAIQSSSSLPIITNFNLVVNAKTLADFSTYFKDVIKYYYCQFSSVSALQRFFLNRNQPNTTYFSVRVRLIEVSAESGFVIKGNIRRSFQDPA